VSPLLLTGLLASVGVLCAALGYVIGRLHASLGEAARERASAFVALGGKADWEVRAAEAEAAAVMYTKTGRTYDALQAMNVALQIHQAHKGDR